MDNDHKTSGESSLFHVRPPTVVEQRRVKETSLKQLKETEATKTESKFFGEQRKNPNEVKLPN